MKPTDIQIKVKLRAYTKGIIPDVSEFIKDAPLDGNTYGRQDGKWINIKDAFSQKDIELAENSGLNLDYDSSNYQYTLGIRKYEINESELPNILEADTTYYVVSNHPNLFIHGGTAFSSGNNEYVIESQVTRIINGGNSESAGDQIFYPINSEGVYNEQ